MSKSVVAASVIIAITVATIINKHDKSKKETKKSLIGNYTKCFICQEKLKYDPIAKSLINEDFAAFTLMSK
eukprot:UN02151